MSAEEPKWSIKKTERMLVVNLCVCVIVMLLNLETAAAIWKQVQARAELFVWMEQLQQRVIALEVVEQERHKQQYKQPPLQQHQPRNQE